MAPNQLPLNRKLVVHQWMLSLFGVKSFEELRNILRHDSLEGLDEDNVHRFYRALSLHIPEERRPKLPDSVLLAYDQEIVAVTERLNERRGLNGEQPIVWKYFQYLALLFTEVYLDLYFRDPDALLHALNDYIDTFNVGLDEGEQVEPFDLTADARTQLNKLAFWMATGSGKTLLMHAHVLQYLRYLEKYGRRRELNRIILLTPNEGLSEQHLREFAKSGIYAQIFRKDGGRLYTGHAVEIIEITKLREEMGETTVAVDAFEGNNLVLVDEGHRGASAGKTGTWMKHRNALCEQGFSFEYSATFGQAVHGDAELTDIYSRSILFDYSYRWFYDDGFGKDYQILNLTDDSNKDWMTTYLIGSLLTFYQQQRLYREKEEELRPFNIERPLWIFVGGSVTATLAKRDASDIIEILRFLDGFLRNRADSVRRIEILLRNGLVTADGKNLFAGRFAYLNTTVLSAEEIFDDILSTTFNASGGGTLYIENLVGASGEIALRVGDNAPFGLINVGDDNKLIRLCSEEGFSTVKREFSESMFHELDKQDSTIHLLIGSKKFTEGWNSWRVSTMGLMNVGRGEGPQIIQLFGRGVRLKGFGMSLKRTAYAPLPDGLDVPEHIDVLETLAIFGIRADYMAQFRDILKGEGVKVKGRPVQFILPISRALDTGRLKTLRLKQRIQGVQSDFGTAFRRLGPRLTLLSPESVTSSASWWLRQNPVVLNWYPRIEAMRSGGLKGGDAEQKLNEGLLTSKHVTFLDLDRLYFELERFKAERGWYNLNITRSGVRDLLHDHSWYRLLIPEEELAFDTYEKVHQWQQIALALLREYTMRYYTYFKREWELPHLEYRPLAEDDRNFPAAREHRQEYGFRVFVDEEDQELLAQLDQLKTAIESGRPVEWSFRGLKAIFFDRHLYQPLLAADNGRVQVSPTPLNKGESRFVEDLKTFCASNPDVLDGTELYLLRNLSKGRGIGFFEAGNFHPDFILWLVRGQQQDIVFIDPKGLLQISRDDPKVRFHETIKEIERRLDDATVSLHSFILSISTSDKVSARWGLTKEEMERRHVLFPGEGTNNYIRRLIQTVLDGDH